MGVVYPGVAVVDTGCRSVFVVTAAAGEVAIYYTLKP
jgi:hypothetical protein